MNRFQPWEKLISGVGGAVSIFSVFGLTQYYEHEFHVGLLLIASMGATAVLLFAAPHSPLAQPWNVIGGHVVCAMIGVVVHTHVDFLLFGAAMAVGLAIVAMYYLKWLHPPGGATALIPFLGGSVASSYGYSFAFMPVGFGAVMMVMIAIAFNYPFPWRRYPNAVAWKKRQSEPVYPDISHADLVAALAEIDTFVDISEQDLLRIYEIACGRAHPELSGKNDSSK